MSQKKATIVNLAASHVSIAVFGADQGSLELQQFLVEEIAPGQTNDDDWLASAVGAVADLVQAHGLTGRRVTVIAPSFLLLQKALKVPQVERERQAQIVAFEAQNAIPYPLNEVIWDSQVMASDGVEAEVLLFALRTEVAARIATLIMGAGLRPASIQAAPLLDSQAFLLAGGAATEEVLIVNVGARSTTLSFVGPTGANIQSANIGGNLLTQGVSDNTGEPFANAEAVKVGYYSGVIHLPEADPKVAVLQANSQAFIRRLAQDINRRLINLKRGTAGRQPTRILLTGRGALVPGLSEQLSETLRLPPELFDPSAFLRLGKNVSAEYVQHHRHQISEVIGEAARLVLPQTAGVNLIPRNIATQVTNNASFNCNAAKMLVLPKGWSRGRALVDAVVGEGVDIRPYSHLEGTVVGDGCAIGPFARLRPGTELADEVHIGNFVETKKARIGRRSKANHLAYLGDAVIGQGCNVGAGTITCNYDGVHKHETRLGDGVFIGSDTQLVAPVTLGDGAYVGAGSTITKDVPADALAFSRAPQLVKEGWAQRRREKLSTRNS
jgi:type IV pilus assembly protein PilM